MEMEKVLVLLSSYNGEKYIDEQIESLFAQEGVYVHVLIRDDGSSDDTTSIISDWMRRDDRITLIAGQHIGFAMSFMTLVKEAYNCIGDYSYFAFCDQDDVWLPKKLLAAVTMLKEKGTSGKSNLYWSGYTLADEHLRPFWGRPNDEEIKDEPAKDVYRPIMTKPTILVRYFMLGCTMVFDRNMVEFIHKYEPKGKLTMHDLWLSQTAIFFGHVVTDYRSYLLYRQHGSNAAGVDISWRGRWRRFKKSLKTYERRHFREINAKNLLCTYQDILLDEDYRLIESVAHYRESFSKRMNLLRNKDINMGTFISDLFIKVRILFGLF